MRSPWHRQRDRYATPRCVRVKTSGKGVQPFLWLSPAPVAVSAEKAGRLTEAKRGLRSDLAFRTSSILSLSLFLPVYRVRARLKVVPLRATRRIRSDRLPAASLQRQEPQAQILGAGGRKALPPFRDSVPLSAVFWARNAISRIRVALGGLHLDSVRGPAPRENSTSTENVRRCTWRADRTYEARASR